MSRPLTTLTALAALVLLPVAIPVSAQQPEASGTTSVIRAQGNPHLNAFKALLSKRADLRLQVEQRGIDAAFTDWLRAEKPEAYREAMQRGETVAARPIIRAQGHPYLQTFKVLANRRADLRYKQATYGTDVAFTEWLRTEKPGVYHETVQRIAEKKSGVKPVRNTGRE
ncbi:MAG: hypothetical protein RMJ43_01585 [Chloroherpetonaceae bacterium]|nr:hypothetical protein [Chthonomonadaceae bacterium]MDW8206499.1 hypothetical protein [Chloroherpetonaceae bacterium]